MNRTVYNQVRRSIRDNGLRYTYQHGIDTYNDAVCNVCHGFYNIGCQTDWLALRLQFARNGSPSVAFKLTATGKAYDAIMANKQGK